MSVALWAEEDGEEFVQPHLWVQGRASETFRVEEASFGTFQHIEVADDGSTASRRGYESRLTLRETIPSFLGRQLRTVLENSFVIAATALAAGGVGYPSAECKRRVLYQDSRYSKMAMRASA